MLAQQPGGEEMAVKQVVDRYIQPFLNNNSIPGAIVGVSKQGHRYFFSYGTATDGGVPFTPTTLVEIGSCTKVFTTTLFALAIARNQIAPNAPIQQYMPKGYKLKPAAQQVTSLELADFTSGMPDSATNLPNNLEMRGIGNYSTQDFLKWVSNWQPDPPPPAPYLYSNAGVGLLSYLVADATGKQWEDQLNAEILGPLGMTDTEMKPSPQQRGSHGAGPSGKRLVGSGLADLRLVCRGGSAFDSNEYAAFWRGKSWPQADRWEAGIR